jgi:hypothetical protein
MSKFDKMYNKITSSINEQSTGNPQQPNVNQNTSTNNSMANRPKVLQGVTNQMSKDIQKNAPQVAQQAQNDLRNLVDAIQKKDENAISNIVKKYGEAALLAQLGNQTPGQTQTLNQTQTPNTGYKV